VLRQSQLVIKAVLFDAGDTLIHTGAFDYDACLQKMHQSLAKNGIAVPYDDFKRIYFEVRDRFYRETDQTLEEQDFAQRVTETLKPLGVELPIKDKRAQEAVEAFMDGFVDSLRIDEYLPSLLEQLHKRYKLAIVSNMSFAEAWFKSLRKFGIAKYFDAVIISGIVGWRKPSPRIFQEALKSLHVKAEESVFVGDSLKADIEGSKQLGMKTVLITENEKKTPSTDTFRLYIGKANDNIRPDKTITELAQLPEALDSFAKQA
jgi:putative hydrolase of the HAD superfamily